MSRSGELAKGDPRITVAVLDGPVDAGHPCFQGALLEFPSGQPDFDPRDAAARHGTQVASIIFGQPGSPVEGIAPRCRGLVIPIFQDRGAKGLACSQLDLARALLAALENGAHFINISGGQLSPSGATEPMLAQAIERCAARGVLIVAAAGNDGCDCLHVPAAAPGVLAVGAMDAAGMPLASSNYGEVYRGKGLLAPGDDVLAAAAGGGAERKRGTSYATTFVTGNAALLACLQIAEGRPPDPLAIRAALLASAAPCPDPEDGECRRFLTGRIDVNAATQLIQGGIVMTEDRTIRYSGIDTGAVASPARSVR